MRIRELPIVKQVFESGAEDRVFDTLLLVGPLVIVLIIVVGRTPITAGIALAYLATFALYVMYEGYMGLQGGD